jgi:hypothetical protein
MAIKRRDLLTSLGVAGVAALGGASLPRSAFAQSPAKVRAG